MCNPYKVAANWTSTSLVSNALGVCIYLCKKFAIRLYELTCEVPVTRKEATLSQVQQVVYTDSKKNIMQAYWFKRTLARP
jgi:hypothetical protein